MIRTCSRLLRHGIATTRIDFTAREIAKNKKIDFHPIVGIKEVKLGACIFNQPSNQNLLTEQFLDELYRYLLSYQFDNSVENVFIQSKEAVFSAGIDFKRMAEDKSYLDKAAAVAILLAKFNKPIFANVSGACKGAGAYMLSMLNMPLGAKNCFLKLDQCSRGMVPLMGGTHRLARLPLRLGYYLALVGEQLNSEQMAQLGFLRGAVCDKVTNADIRHKFHETNMQFRERFTYLDFDDEQSLSEADEKTKIEENMDRYKSEQGYYQAELLSSQAPNINMRFALNQHLATNVDYHNITSPFSSFSEDESGRNINNYFQMRLEKPLKYLKEHGMVIPFDIRGVQLNRFDCARIDHIFAKDSIEEILKALKEQNAPWAQIAYNKIKTADPLAIRLTFELLRKAEQSPWIECLERQFTVARRLLEISQLKLRTFKNSSHYIYVNEYSQTDVTKLSEDVVNSFFEPAEGEYKLEHSIVDHALLPTVDYYKIVPDSARAYLNKEGFVDKHYPEQVPQILRFLKSERINYNSKVYDVDILRRNVYEKLEIEFDKERLKLRLGFYAAHDHELQKYMAKREDSLDTTNDSYLEEVVEREVKDLFRKKFQNRFAAFEEKTAKIMGLEKKIKLFKNIKNTILNNILYKGHEIEVAKKKKNEFVGPIYFDSKGKDVYQSTNTYVEEDPVLRQLATDVSQGNTLSESFNEYSDFEMPKFFGMRNQLRIDEEIQHNYWAKIKFWYDDRPELWAEAYTYKQLIIQASRTSEQIAGYLDWSFRNLHDLFDYTENMNQTYGNFGIDMINEVNKAREDRIQKLKDVEEARNDLQKSNIFSKLYTFQSEQKMRSIFPYYFKENSIPREFRRCFLQTLDSTLKEFTSMYETRGKSKLLVREELGVFDQWINNSVAEEYTQFLKHDVEYVTSYLQILFVKDILSEVIEYERYDRNLNEILEVIKEKYCIDFRYGDSAAIINYQHINKLLITYLYYLADMHSQAKRHIKSPQSKLIDFINRVKISYEFDSQRALPYSFEGLLLMIAKDRKKVYDRAMGNKFISQPEFLLQYITRQSKKSNQDLEAPPSELYPNNLDKAMESQFDMQYSFSPRSKHLVQGFFYYLMEFERQIHKICGAESFIPQNYVNAEYKKYNQYCHQLINHKSDADWLQNQIRAVIEQLFQERQEIEPKLTKGQLFLYDQKLNQQLKPENIRTLVKAKLTEEVFLVRNLFKDPRQFSYELKIEDEADQQYVKMKRIIKNSDALKKLNNLHTSEQIYQEYMEKFEQQRYSEKMNPYERKFAENEKLYYKNGMCTRLPFKSYHRMARDIFSYPEESIKVPTTQYERDQFKKLNIRFDNSLSGEKITLSNFTSEYKQMSKAMKNSLLDEMVEKINRVQNL